MPVPEERLYHPGRLNRWFAVSSVLMTASFFWMIWVDYRRPWQDHQESYMVSKAALAHLDWVDENREEKQKEIAIAEQRVEDAKKLDESVNKTKREELDKALAEADLNFKIADAPFGRITQVLQVSRDTYERMLGEHGPDHPDTKAAAKVVDDQVAESERWRKDKEKWEDKRREVSVQLKALDKDIREAQRKVTDLKATAAAALEKDQAFRGVLTDEGLLAGLPIVRTLINWPLLDFTAPKNTPSRLQVNQLVLPEVRQRLNYLESYTTDRCTTCHVAINDPAFEQETLALRLERAIPGINEAMQKLGKPALSYPPAPVIDSSGATVLKPGSVAEHWDELSKTQRNEYFNQLVALTNEYFKASGRKTIELGQPVLAHPDLELYVTVDSPHPMNQMGCTVCHEGNPQETDFVFAAHSPPTHEIENRWKDQYYINILGVPNMTFETMAHFWDRPMRWPQYAEAGCSKCHSQIADIDRFRGDRKGERINHGRYLFTNLGCINCHTEDSIGVERRVGPDLQFIASKLKPDFASQWIYFPQKFRPSTRMPHFFEQENNRAESYNEFDQKPVLRTETEVAAMTKYLFAVSKPWKAIEKPAEVKGDANRGRELFKQVGCTACHANLAEFGKEWIAKDVARREKIDEEKAGLRYEGMTYEERSLYAREHFANEVDTFLHPEKVVFDPNKPAPPPTFSRFAPDLSSMGSKVTAEWLYSWLVDPQHYSNSAKMPSLRLSSEESADIAAYLMTLKHDRFESSEFELNGERLAMADTLLMGLLSAQRSERASKAFLHDDGKELTNALVSLLEKSLEKQPAYDLISSMSLVDKKLMYLGNKMIGHYGCYACHNIAGFETTTPPGTTLNGWAEKPVSQLDFAFYNHAFHDMRHEKEAVYGHVYPKDAVELNKWSPGENPEEQITHTHSAFAKHKLLNPRIWDREKIKGPYDKLKMPNFYLGEDEADAVTTFLLSRIPARVGASLQVDYDSGVNGPLARGRNLMRELNCIGCHEVDDNVPTIQQYFRRSINNKFVFDSLNAPPSLRGEGAKLQHAWFHHFLQNVEPLRPWLQVRMPSFRLTNEEATTLVEYFAHQSMEEAKMLADAHAPVQEYVSSAKKAAATKGEEAIKSAGVDWFAGDSLRVSSQTLRQFAVDRKLVRTNEVDMLRASPETVREGHAKVLERTGFLKDLYNVSYPFVEPPRPLSPDDRFELGGKFMNDLGCLKCHVLGTMLTGPAKNTDDFPQTYRLDSVRGEGENAVAILNGKSYPVGSTIDGHKLISASNTFYESGDVETKAIFEGPKSDGSGVEKIQLQAASAPNLSLTHRRLRRDWVVDWMLQPSWMQPGTKMPQNFLDGKSPFEGDPRYPGTGADHIQLLVDYLYDAGVRNARAALPKIIAAEPKGFEEEEAFEDE